MEPSIEKHLQLSTFQGKFDVTDFIGSVSERLIARSKDTTGPFDPKPFIRNFEAVVDRLIAVRKDVQAKTEQMEKSVRVAEREYSIKMADLNRGFEQVGSSFSGMESRMGEVSSTAIRIGEQLETISIERQRAQAAYDIIDFYNQMAKNDVSRLDAMRKEGRPGRRQVAVLLRRLSIVAKEVELPNADKTRENIERYCEKFENEMLNLFNRSYRKGDPKMMHHCAQTLLEFNGGTACVTVYVNQHDFFINSVREAKHAEDGPLWDTIPDPDAIPPKTESGLAELFTEIRSTVDTEAQIVKAVFPNPPVVMQVFLQRVFAQPVQQHVEQLLHKGSSLSDLAYLRMLQLVHVQCSSLVEDLKVYELPSVSIRTSIEGSDFRRSISGPSGPAGTTSTVSTMLETAMEELFVQYIDGQRYVERESKSLSFLYTTLLSPFSRYHQNALKGKNSTYYDRIVNQLSTAAATTSASGTSSAASQAANALLRFGGIDRTQIQDEDIAEEDGLLSVSTAERMLKWHAEAIGRCVELSNVNDVPKHTFSLLKVLADFICRGYLELALETTLYRLEADSKGEPNVQLLSVLRGVDLICHLWQQYVNTALLPLANAAVTIRREMTVFNNQSVSKLEGAVNGLISKTADAIVAYLAQQLGKQKKNDFKPRNDDISFARVNTEPCLACCEFLEKVSAVARLTLSGKNLEAFLTEVGVSFHSLLLEHMRKFPVSATGGLMLAKDIKSYQDIIATFNIPALTERFEFIRQLGSIFLVRPEILKSYITENYLGRIEPSLLQPYLANRSDWGQFGFEGDEGSQEGGRMKDRFGRLSVMMKDLESLKSEGMKLGEGIVMGMPAMPGMALPTIPTTLTAFGKGLGN